MNKLKIAFITAFTLISLCAAELVVASPSNSVGAYPLTGSYANPVAPAESTNWQEEANASIEKIRKGEVEIVVKDSEGKPIPQTKVLLEQQSHDFWFGVAISDYSLVGYRRDPAIIQPYQQTIKDYFNAAVLGNALKWPFTEPQQGKFQYQVVDDWLNWCEQNGIRMRGHCLFWEDEKMNSIANVGAAKFGYTGWISNLDKEPLRKAVEQRAKDVTSRYRGRITEYDVNNEMLLWNFFRSRLGPGIIGDMFRWAKEGDPNATLYTNEILWPPWDVSAERYVQLIKSLLDQGVPVGGIGLQAHFSDFKAPDRISPPPP